MEYNMASLKKILDNEALLEEEKKMWLRIGIYVTSSTKTVADGYSSANKNSLYDSAGNLTYISTVMAKNIRLTIIEWWQVEKVKPHSQEKVELKQAGPLDELENRNAT